MQGKVSDEKCEDASFISDDFVAVIDGVSSKSDFLFKEKTTGKIAAEIVKSVLEKSERSSTRKEIVERINQEIMGFYEAAEFPYSRNEYGPQAVCAVYSDFYREVWLIGDCQVCVDGRIYTNPKRSDEILAEMRSLVLNIIRKETPEQFSDQKVQQMARDIIEPWIVRANVFANNNNSDYGYSVINGEEIPENLFRVIKLDEGTHEIILASDGYPRIERTLRESEDYLSRMLETDRECCSLYHSTKGVKDGCSSYDDRTYIRFLVGSMSENFKK